MSHVEVEWEDLDPYKATLALLFFMAVPIGYKLLQLVRVKASNLVGAVWIFVMLVLSVVLLYGAIPQSLRQPKK